MAVQLPNTMLGVRNRPPETLDGHGRRQPGPPGPLRGPWAGTARPQGAGGAWLLSLDPAAWPVEVGDLGCEPGGREWTLTTVQNITNSFEPEVDYVRCEARPHEGGHTVPSRTEQRSS